ncbi:MAG: hypothetical protein IKF64_02295 [Eubacterium sp.]|nr:hypothetical protein [Eubacterium sp.]
MADKLINGDYELADGQYALVECDYTEELLQNAYVLLKSKRGQFYPNKNFGSKIYAIDSEPADEYLRAYAEQALASLDGVYVKSARFENGTAVIRLVLNNKEGLVRINFENNV